MRMVLCAAAAAAWFATATAAPATPIRPAARARIDSTNLVSKLPGKWRGSRFEAGSSIQHPFTMEWKKASDGHLEAKVSVAKEPSYQTSVVWTSDTNYVTESAPHRSVALNEEVVTRTVSHLKGDSVTGTFELRPTSYEGRTMKGRFTAVRQK
jgi:hypothetical protein